MTQTASTTAAAQVRFQVTFSAAVTGFDRLVARYRQDHRHPVNHVLHVGVGWPMVGAAIVLLPFRPLSAEARLA